jgi:GDP-L-fucose synthase
MSSVILGAGGFIGSAVSRRIPNARPYGTSSIGEYSLDRYGEWLHTSLHRVDVIYLCAGRTGGVGRMVSDPLSFVYPNVRIHMNVFEAAVKAGVRRVVCVGSTTGYPDTGLPVTEDQYLEGDLHPAYFVPGNAHRFIKRLAMMEKRLETVFFRVIWGTGDEIRDAIYIDDLAEAIALGADCPPGDYNVGSGEELSVNQIADVLMGHAVFLPTIHHDLSKPTAIPARRVDCTKLKALGWSPKVGMADGLKRTYEWYKENTWSKAQ